MKYQDIVDLKRRMEFKMTEPETLVKLVKDAQSKGEKVQKDMERLRNICSEITRFFEENKLILGEATFQDVQLRYKCAVGIDGSFQLVGGVGGTWYAPISVARIIFENGFGTQPRVDIFWAGIEEIKEEDDPKPNIVASIMMLSGESKAILNWGTLNKEAYVFVDGPIVDPPVISYGGKDYVKDRCEGIMKCAEKSSVVGCVKRSRDKFYIEYLKTLISDESLTEYLQQFPSDQHLMVYVFAHLRSKGYLGPIFTKWIDVSSINPLYKLYKEQGVYVVCFFFQKGVRSQILRVDVPFLESPNENPIKIDKEIIYVAKAVDEWTYPGQDSPLPVFLAHNKCNIREGCAEVLYEEIMTKSRSVDPRNQVILTWMR